jgi:hypothetical protein
LLKIVSDTVAPERLLVPQSSEQMPARAAAPSSTGVIFEPFAASRVAETSFRGDVSG